MYNLAIMSEIRIPLGHGYDFEVSMNDDVPYVVEERDISDIQVFYNDEFQGRFPNVQTAFAFVDYCHRGGYSLGDIDAFSRIHKIPKKHLKGSVHVEKD